MESRECLDRADAEIDGIFTCDPWREPSHIERSTSFPAGSPEILVNRSSADSVMENPLCDRLAEAFGTAAKPITTALACRVDAESGSVPSALFHSGGSVLSVEAVTATVVLRAPLRMQAHLLVYRKQKRILPWRCPAVKCRASSQPRQVHHEGWVAACNDPLA